MTNQQKLEAIREACIAVNPDIKTLKFGCRLLRKSGGVYQVINDRAFGGDSTKCWINSVPFGAMPIELEKDLIQNGGEFEIIGREIGLADVCLLIEQKAKNIGWIELLKRFTAFTAVIGNEGHLYYYLIGTWNLRLPLDEQDDPTVDFIYELTKHL